MRKTLETILGKTQKIGKKALRLVTPVLVTGSAYAGVSLEMDTYLDNGFPRRSFATNSGATIMLVVRANATSETNKVAGITWSINSPSNLNYIAARPPNSEGYINWPDSTGLYLTDDEDFFHPKKMDSTRNNCNLTNNTRFISIDEMNKPESGALTNQQGVIGIYQLYCPKTSLLGKRDFKVVGQAYDAAGRKLETFGSTITIGILSNWSQLDNKVINYINGMKNPNTKETVTRVYSDFTTKSNMALQASSNIDDFENCEVIATSEPNSRFFGYALPIDHIDNTTTNYQQRFYSAINTPVYSFTLQNKNSVTSQDLVSLPIQPRKSDIEINNNGIISIYGFDNPSHPTETYSAQH